jgi:hypothetical protein
LRHDLHTPVQIVTDRLHPEKRPRIHGGAP